MTEPIVTCPNCRTDIKLTESLAAPLISAMKVDFERRLAEKDMALRAREASLAEREKGVIAAQAAVEARLAERLKDERTKIAAAEARNARHALDAEMQARTQEIANLQGVLAEREAKLAEAQQAQAVALRKQRELDDARRELDLTVERRIEEGLAKVKDQARQEAEGQLRLKVAEKEQTIVSMQRQIEELRQKAEQGSQQLQGEVQEIELERMLMAAFPKDTIEPVPKGEFGGDVIQCVMGPSNQLAGTILWESKRTRGWSDLWLQKLRDNQRAAKAEIAVLVSQTLPKDIELFGQVEGVWVVHPRVAIPLGAILRHSIVQVTAARHAGEGQQAKTEMVYDYLTSPRFCHRVEAIVEAFSTMKEDLDRERKAIMKQWAKREEQINRVVDATVGMYGDFQGIVGKTMKEIDGLEFAALEDKS